MAPRVEILLKVTLHYFIYFLQVNGLFPYYFNANDRILYSSNICILYSMVFYSIYGYFIGRNNVGVLQNQLNLNYDYNTVLIVASVFSAFFQVYATFFEVYIFREKFRLIFNEFLRLWSVLRLSNIPISLDKKLLLKFFYKLFAVDGLIIIIVVTYYAVRKSTNPILDVYYRATPMATTAAIANMFIAIGYLGAHYHRILNLRIQLLHARMAKIEQNPHFWRLQPQKKRQIITQFAGELRKIEKLHLEITDLTSKFMQLHAPTLLLMAIKNFIVVITGLFGIYGSTLAMTAKNRKPQLGACLFYLVLTVSSVVEFYLWVGSAAICTLRAEKTGLILDDFEAGDSVNKFDELVKSMSLRLMHVNHKIETLGLFSIDFSLLYAALGTMINYLIVVVQFQLSKGWTN